MFLHRYQDVADGFLKVYCQKHIEFSYCSNYVEAYNTQQMVTRAVPLVRGILSSFVTFRINGYVALLLGVTWNCTDSSKERMPRKQ
jgi:hypothetical protein